MDSSNLDKAIDTIARDITAGEPSAAFRERVAARLDERRGTPWFWIGGTLLAAGAAVALMVVGTRPAPTPDLKVGGSVRTSASAPTEPTEPPTFRSGELKRDARTENPRTPNPGTQNPRTLEPRTLEPSADVLAWESRAIPALTSPDVRAFSNIQPEPLEIRPLVTPALSVPAIGEDEDR